MYSSIRFKILLFFGFFLVSFLCEAQQLSFDIKTVEKVRGLKDATSITDIKPDKDGNLWVVGFNFIIRYDGDVFKEINTSNLTHNYLLRFYETSKGKKFVIDSEGLLYFIEADTIRHYEYNDTLLKLNQRNRFLDVYFDEMDRLHISYYGSGYCIIDKGKVSYPLREKGHQLFGFVCILKKEGLPFMSAEYFGKSDTLPVQKYYVFDENLNLIDRRDASKLKYRFHPAVVRKQNGNYLWSSGYGDIWEFNEGGFIREIPCNFAITNLFIDKNNGLWLSNAGGSYYYENAILNHEKRIDLKIDRYSIISMQDYEGGIWGYDAGQLYYIPLPQRRLINREGKLIHNNIIRDFELVGNKIYATTGANNRVSIIDVTNLTLDSLITDSLLDMQEGHTATNVFNDVDYTEKEERFWLLRRGKIFYFQHNKWSELLTDKLDGAIKHTVYFLSAKFQSDEYSFGAFYSNKFFLGNADTISYVSPPYSKAISGIFIFNDSIFVRTLDGLYLQIGDSITNLSNKYPKLNGLVYKLIKFQGKIWLSIKQKGIFIMHEDSLREITYEGTSIKAAILLKSNSKELWMMNKYGSYVYNSEDGDLYSNPIPIKASNPYQITNLRREKADSIFYYSGSNSHGISISKFDDIKNDPLLPPRLMLTQLKINRDEKDPSDSSYQVAYNESFIQISYVGISFNKEKMIYRHRLVGLERDWSETEEKYVQYTTLPSGEYAFEIQCKKNDQAWSESKFLHFDVLPPFWETWWFIILSALFILFISYQVIAYRFKVAQKEKDLLVDRLQAQQSALRAQMDPHFVFNVIASVKYLITAKANEKANQFLDMFSDSMRNILDQANENYITIENEVKFLREYIEMENFRLEEHFNYKVVSTGLEDNLQDFIPPFLIQPFVENAIQHGLKNREQGGQLNIVFGLEQAFLKITVLDNGIGRERASQYQKNKKNDGRKSHGLRIIKERLALHNGRKENVITTDLFDEQNNSRGTEAVVYIKIINQSSIKE